MQLLIWSKHTSNWTEEQISRMVEMKTSTPYYTPLQQWKLVITWYGYFNVKDKLLTKQTLRTTWGFYRIFTVEFSCNWWCLFSQKKSDIQGEIWGIDQILINICCLSIFRFQGLSVLHICFLWLVYYVLALIRVFVRSVILHLLGEAQDNNLNPLWVFLQFLLGCPVVLGSFKPKCKLIH